MAHCSQGVQKHVIPTEDCLKSWNSKYEVFLFTTVYRVLIFKGNEFYLVNIRTSEVIFLENNIHVNLLQVFYLIVKDNFRLQWKLIH